MQQRRKKLAASGTASQSVAFKEAPKTSKDRGERDRSSSLNSYWVILLCICLFTLKLYYYIYFKLAFRLSTPTYFTKTVSKSLESDPELLWGTYRSHTYFGIKPRLEKAPVVGIMWFEHDKYPPDLRHWCNQDDKLKRYGYLKHDGVRFAVQELIDKSITINTTFVKDFEMINTGSWSTRLDVRRSKGKAFHSIMLYVAIEGDYRYNVTRNDATGALTQISLITDQFFETSGSFDIDITDSLPESSGEVMRSIAEVKFESLASLSDLVKNNLLTVDEKTKRFIRMPNIRQDGANLIVYHLAVGDIGEAGREFRIEMAQHLPNVQPRLVGEELGEVISSLSKEFDARFNSTFPFVAENSHWYRCGQAMLSNLIGGMSFFTGSSVVRGKIRETPREYFPTRLFTAVPSRSFFPRGFLWDEGFHTLILSRWDARLAVQSVAHWLDTMNVDGWIPREQILGEEALARVPHEFVTQLSDNANPPTFFLTIDRLLSMNESPEGEAVGEDMNVVNEFLHNSFDRLHLWFNWFNRTQYGPLAGTYQWRGRVADSIYELNPKTLMSGLDDYPRASHPTGDEYHLDLRCWMQHAACTMQRLAAFVDRSVEVELYASSCAFLSDESLLVSLHWSKKRQMFADYGVHTDQVALKWRMVSKDDGQGRMREVREMHRVESATPKARLVTSNFGYVSLFPLMFHTLSPNSPYLEALLKSLKDATIWTKFGIRSLSSSSPLYAARNTEHDPPYWRGAIWINMNYLILRGLHFYAENTGPQQQLALDLHNEMRSNLIKNVVANYAKRGYMYEQYNDQTGVGQGSHPFTGWSSLTLLIMGEKY